MSFPKADPSESKRRQGVTRTALNSTAPDSDMVKPSLQFNDPSQRYALVNLANRHLAPQSVSPALRVLGLFPSQEAALRYLSRNPTTECNTYLVETCKWNLIPQSASKTPEECYNTVEQMLVDYYKTIVLNKLDFDERRAKNGNQKVEERVFENPAYPLAVKELEKRGISLESVQAGLVDRRREETKERIYRIQEAKQKEKESSTTQEEVKDRGRQQQVDLRDQQQVDLTSPFLRSDESVSVPEKQNLVWLSILHRDDEPAYCIYGALETEAESKGFDFFVLRSHAAAYDTTCACMGTWLYTEQAEQLDKHGLATYRLDEQNRIMAWNQSVKNRQFSDMEGLTIEADRVLEDSGLIVPLASETDSGLIVPLASEGTTPTEGTEKKDDNEHF